MGMNLTSRISKLLKQASVSVACATALSASAYAQFANPKNVIELNSGSNETHAVVSADNLRCFFSTARDDPTMTQYMDIWYAERPDTAVPFTVIGPAPNLNTPGTERSNTLLSDELTFYISRISGRPSGDWDIYVTTRPNTSQPFSTPALVPELSTTANELDPTVSSDGLEMYFETLVNGDNKIMRTTRLNTASPWGVPQLVTELDVCRYQLNPVLYGNDNEMVFGCDLANKSDIDICYTKRANKTSSWQTPSVITVVSSLLKVDTPSAVAGTKPSRVLYFFSDRPDGIGGTDIWSASESGNVCPSTVAPDEVMPIILVKDPKNVGMIKVLTDAISSGISGYNVYENDMGNYAGTNQLICGLLAVPLNPFIGAFSFQPTKPSQFYIITASNCVGEGPGGSIPTPKSCGAY